LGAIAWLCRLRRRRHHQPYCHRPYFRCVRSPSRCRVSDRKSPHRRL